MKEITKHTAKLQKEIDELKGKMERLENFIDTDERATFLHTLQFSAMNTYYGVLIARLESEK